MKRTGISAIVVAMLGLLVAPISQGDTPDCKVSEARELVDLGEPQVDPSALQRVRERRSDHYKKIIGVMESFLSPAPPFDPAATEQRYGAKNICTLQILPTQPPKIVLRFTIDDLGYRVTLRRVAGPPPQ